MKRINMLFIIIAILSGNITKLTGKDYQIFFPLNEKKINQAFFQLVNNHRKNLNLDTAIWADEISLRSKEWAKKNLQKFEEKIVAYASNPKATSDDRITIMSTIEKSTHDDFEERFNIIKQELCKNLVGREICHFTILSPKNNGDNETEIAAILFRAFMDSPAHKRSIEKRSIGPLLMGTGTVIVENRLYTATIFAETAETIKSYP